MESTSPYHTGQNPTLNQETYVRDTDMSWLKLSFSYLFGFLLAILIIAGPGRVRRGLTFIYHRIMRQ